MDGSAGAGLNGTYRRDIEIFGKMEGWKEVIFLQELLCILYIGIGYNKLIIGNCE